MLSKSKNCNNSTNANKKEIKIKELKEKIQAIEKELTNNQRNFSIICNKENQEVERRKFEVDSIQAQLSSLESRIELMNRNKKGILHGFHIQTAIISPQKQKENHFQTHQKPVRKVVRRNQRIIFKKPPILKPLEADPKITSNNDETNNNNEGISQKEHMNRSAHKVAFDTLLSSHEIYSPKTNITTNKSPYEMDGYKSPDSDQRVIEVEAPNTEPARSFRISVDESPNRKMLSPPNSADSSNFFTRKKGRSFEDVSSASNQEPTFEQENESVPSFTNIDNAQSSKTNESDNVIDELNNKNPQSACITTIQANSGSDSSQQIVDKNENSPNPISKDSSKEIYSNPGKSPLTDDLLRLPMGPDPLTLSINLCKMPIIVRNSAEFFSRNNSEKKNSFDSEEMQENSDDDQNDLNKLDQLNANEQTEKIKQENQKEIREMEENKLLLNRNSNVQTFYDDIGKSKECFEVKEPKFNVDNIAVSDRAPRTKPQA